MTAEKKEKGTVTMWQDPNIVIDGKSYFVPSEKRWTAKEAQPGDGAEFIQYKGTISALWINVAPQKQILHEETVKKATAAGFGQPGVTEVMTEAEQNTILARSAATTQPPVQSAQTPTEPQGEAPGATIKKEQPIGWGIPTREKLIVYQTCYKECCETVRALVLLPTEILDEVEFNRIMDIAVVRAIADGKKLIEAGGV